MVCVRSLADALRMLKEQAAPTPAQPWAACRFKDDNEIIQIVRIIQGSLEMKVLLVSF